MHRMKKLAAAILSGIIAFGIAGGCAVDASASLRLAARGGDVSTTGSLISDMFLTQGEENADNTWLFAGGGETQGKYADIAGRRSYIGHFQECVRRTDGYVPEGDIVHNGENRMNQRYVFNVGRDGRDLSGFLSKADAYIAQMDPRAISYLIGEEDYGKGEEGREEFQKNLEHLITKGLALREGKGFVVVQLPHAVKDAQAMEQIPLYIEAAEEAVLGFSEQEQKRIVWVDHFTDTNTADFLNGENLTEEGRLNANGHLLIGRQLCEATIKNTRYFSVVNKIWEEADGPDAYLDVMPKATALADGLRVRIPGEAGFSGGCRWRLEIDGMVMENEADANTFDIEDLTEGAAYKLTVFSKDGSVCLSSVYGSINEKEDGKEQEKSPLQRKLLEKMEDGEPLTWLFTGDSITHGLLHTYGYDAIAQSFEKYLLEDLGRTEDVVINTGVSATDTLFTVENINERVSKYHPDVVSVMLGTNDVYTGSDNPPSHKDENGNRITITREMYRKNLEEIVAAIRDSNPDAFIIFRSPSPTSIAVRKTNLTEGGYLQTMQDVAEEDGNILHIDQYTDWTLELETFTYLWGAGYYFGDRTLHPGAAGQQRMMQQFVRECGLNTDTRLAGLSYRFDYTDENSPAKPEVEVVSAHSVQLDLDELQNAYGSGAIGAATLTLTDSFGTTYTKSSRPSERILTMEHLPASRHYEASVTALAAGGAAKRVTFAPPAERITLSVGTEADDVRNLLARLEEICENGQDDYTKESYEAFLNVYNRVKEESAAETDVEILAGLQKELEDAYSELETDEALIQIRKELDDALQAYKNTLEKDGEKYEKTSWDAFAGAFQKAEEAVLQGEREKESLKAVLANLRSAYAALKEKEQQNPNPQPPQTTQKLTAPGILSLTAVAEKKMVGIKIEVEKTEGASAYQVYRVADGKETFIGRTDASGVVYDENPIGGKEAAYYAVAETSAAGYANSDRGAAKTIRPAAAPKKVQAKQMNGKTQVLVTWKTVKGAKSYVIYRSQKKDAGYVKAAVVKGAKKTAYTDRKVQKGKTFYYKVVVKTKDGYGAPKTSKAVKLKRK